MPDANAKPDEAAAVDVAMQLRLAIMEGAGQLAESALAEIERLRRVAEVLRCFPLPSQSASTTENYRRILEWLYRDSTDRLICDLAAEAAAGCTKRLAQAIGDQNADPETTERASGEAASQMLVNAADYIAATLPKDIDPRAWRTLLIYAPAEELWRRMHRETECAT